MSKLKILSLIFISATVLLLSSCDKKGCGETNISSAGQDESHKMGQDCMNCHHDGGKGEGCFIVAGTAYDQSSQLYPDVAVKLYTQPNGAGELVLTLTGDKNGNFFTTESVNFAGGLYPAVTGKSGVTSYMSGSVSQGACNSCHGVTDDIIRIN